MNPPIVIKVGGSLLTWEKLPQRLPECLARWSNAPCVLVVGGGRAADAVRELDQIHGLGDDLAHVLALRSLDLTAFLLAALLPGSQVVDQLQELPAVWSQGRLPILAPRRFLDEVDSRSSSPLPASWDVTSDSIAARLAVYLQASQLILLKSTSLPPGINRGTAAELGFVDSCFANEVKTLAQVAYINLRDPDLSARPL